MEIIKLFRNTWIKYKHKYLISIIKEKIKTSIYSNKCYLIQELNHSLNNEPLKENDYSENTKKSWKF